MSEAVSLKRRALKSSVIELGGYATSQILRLASNLILTRLLFPEAFGLAALVGIFIQGLGMLSDVGVEQSVVQNPRGDDPRFLNTAWILHVTRGVGIWIFACALAWPMALLYHEPQLLYLLPVGAISVLIGAFTSTSLFTLRRRLELMRLTWIELGSQVCSLIGIVAWALIQPSVWALVVGGMAGAIYKTVASHWIDVGYRNRFEWDPHAYREIVSFGKWIFGSTALTFAGGQGDRLLLGNFMGAATLGIYNIALFLSEAIGSAVSRITGGVLYPVFSQVQRETPERMREIYYRVRARLDVASLVPMGMLMALSQRLVDLLYDSRYHEAGWMMQWLCIRVAMGAVLGPMETCLFSMGHTRYGFYRNVGRTVWILAGIPLGWQLAGLPGAVVAIAMSEIPVLLILWVPFYRLRLLWIKRELLAAALFVAGALLGWGVDRFVAVWLPQGSPAPHLFRH